MKQKKKSRLFNLICSFVPGASEMYMGFMKNGLSLMTIFALSFIVLSALRLNDVFVLISIVMWAYSFFHARNIAAATDAEFEELEDKYIWEEFIGDEPIPVKKKAEKDASFKKSLKKWSAMILIVVGMAMLWNSLFDIIIGFIPDRFWDALYPIVSKIPQLAVAVIIIVIGVKLISGKKMELEEEIAAETAGENKTETVTVNTAETATEKVTEQEQTKDE